MTLMKKKIFMRPLFLLRIQYVCHANSWRVFDGYDKHKKFGEENSQRNSLSVTGIT